MHPALEKLKEVYPTKFVSESRAFGHIRRGDTVFISTGCGEPQYLVQALTNYIDKNPSAFFDVEIFHEWTLGAAPYTNKKYADNFRYNSFFIAQGTRDAVNRGLADYTPIFLSQAPRLFHRKLIPVDVALIQTSLPDDHGYVSLGVSVDITKAAVDNAKLVVAQINANMPRIHGDGFIHVENIDFIFSHDEPLLEYHLELDEAVVEQIGRFLSRLIQNGDTIQVGYGSTPNAVLPYLEGLKHLGVHTELLSDGIVALMKRGVIDNTRKTLNQGRTVAAFCLGTADTYEYLHDNPTIELRTADYTNNPLIIARQENMTAINSTLEIDLTGQATAESLGKVLYNGIGGQADFMRGAVLAPQGKAILVFPSTAENGEISRIVPFFQEGSAITLNRGDVHYAITEFGIAYLRGKNIRERAMALISIAHPKFRPWLIEEAKKQKLIYADQAYIPGKGGEYPQDLETYRTTRRGLELFLRPVKISDEPLLKDFFYSLSDESLQRRFMSVLKSMPHERLQEFVVIDYTQQMVILAVIKHNETIEEVVGIGQYNINRTNHTADAAFAVKDAYHGQGVGTELLSYLTYLAKKRGLLGFTADVLADNWRMLHLFNKMGFDMQKRLDSGAYELTMMFQPGTKER